VTPQYTGIYIVHPDGSALRRITGPLETAGTPHWSPDGLAFDSTSAMYEVCRGG
jgi:Tol biopolymer transport system component